MDDLISRSELKPKEKKPEIAGVHPEIIVIGTKDKHYFEIKYFNTADQTTHIGFGSYCLDFVFDWLKEYFGSERAHINGVCAAQPEVRRGKWELRHVGAGHYWECSACHKNPCIYVTKNTNFCPNCGADMREVEHETD